MRRILQLILFGLLFLISVFFYLNYLKENKQVNKIKEKFEDKTLPENSNNLIKNLSYEVKFDDNTQYIIFSELSELTYENDIEIVKMSEVTAKIIDQKNLPLVIKSNSAIYNNANYNTQFSKDVLIRYKDNTINSENLDLDFTKNIVTIYNNVVYESLTGLANTDNINIDLNTKKINIFMNDKKNKVKLISK